MGDGYLPSGVSQETGILVWNGQHTLAAVATDETEDLAANLGGDLAIGVFGANYRINPAATTTEATILLSLDPSATSGAGSVGSQILGCRIENIDQTADASATRNYSVMLPGPIFTVKSLRYIMSMAGAVGTWEWELYYAIFRVTPSNLTRIAGIVLGRG